MKLKAPDQKNTKQKNYAAQHACNFLLENLSYYSSKLCQMNALFIKEMHRCSTIYNGGNLPINLSKSFKVTIPKRQATHQRAPKFSRYSRQICLCNSVLG